MRQCCNDWAQMPVWCHVPVTARCKTRCNWDYRILFYFRFCSTKTTTKWFPKKGAKPIQNPERYKIMSKIIITLANFSTTKSSKIAQKFPNQLLKVALLCEVIFIDWIWVRSELRSFCLEIHSVGDFPKFWLKFYPRRRIKRINEAKN